MNKIKRVSLFFKIIFQLIFIATPILLILSWLYAPNELVLFNGSIKLNAIPHEYSNSILHVLSLKEKILGFFVSAIPMLVNMFMIYSLIKLFGLYEKGSIFSLENVRHIRNAGIALLINQILNPFYQVIMGLVLTLNNPHGHRQASITLDQTDAGMLFMSILIILISWIMAEGYKLQEEQQLTV